MLVHSRPPRRKHTEAFAMIENRCDSDDLLISSVLVNAKKMLLAYYNIIISIYLYGMFAAEYAKYDFSIWPTECVSSKLEAHVNSVQFVSVWQPSISITL